MLTLSYVSPDTRRKAVAGTMYSLTLVNESAQDWTFYVFQKPPKEDAHIFSLAWFSSPDLVGVGTQITFEWEIDYNVMWSRTGEVLPGVTFHASGKKSADPTGANTTIFKTIPAPGLTDPTKGGSPGTLVIHDEFEVPNLTYAVGIGMSGAGTHVVQAGADLTHHFTPTPNYWVAAGANVKIGTILDITTVTKAAEAKFGSDVFNIVATLDDQNQWSFRKG